jgi:Zn-dependent protease
VVLHEFGHALMARRLGIPVERIMLLPIGGMALLGRMPRSAGKELLIVAAGPLVNFTIAGVCYALLGHFPTDVDAIDPGTLHAVDILQFLLVANLALGLFNLVPAFPMDGGRVLRALLAFRYDYLKATWIALWVGRVVALLGILLALAVLHAYLLAALFGFVLFLGDLEYTQLRREQQRAEFTAWIER